VRRFVAAAFASLACARFASAHEIGVEVKLKRDLVLVEAFFDDGLPAADARATVTDAGGSPIAEGKTDSDGMWSFTAPPVGKYKAAVDAGDDHVAHATFVVPPQAEAALPATDASAKEVVASAGPARPVLSRATKRAIAVACMAAIALVATVALLLARKKPSQSPPEAVQ
jgi:nickel transport protein